MMLWQSSSAPLDPEPVTVPAVVEETQPSNTVEPRVLDVSDLPSHRLRAEAAVVYNPETHEIVWATDAQQQRPIASITKVMTALVVLDQQIDLTGDVVVSAKDVRRASTTYLRRRERVTLDNLMHLALIASDNAAARVLARATGLGTKEFWFVQWLCLKVVVKPRQTNPMTTYSGNRLSFRMIKNNNWLQTHPIKIHMMAVESATMPICRY